MSLTKATYSMVNGAPVNVLDYGAVGDGVTDDSAAFNSALTAATNVYVPSGTYKIASTLTFQNANTRLYGSNATLSYTGIGNAVTFNGKAYCEISGLTIDTLTGANGVVLSSLSHNGKVTNCIIDGFSSSGISISQSFYGIFSGNDVTNCGVGILCTNEANGNLIIGNAIRQNLVGVRVDDTTNPTNGVEIIGNQIESAKVGSLYGVYLLGVNSIVVNGNRIELTQGTSQIFVNSSASHTANYNQLIGNVCEGTIAGVTIGDGVGVAQVNYTSLFGGRAISLIVNSDATYFVASIDYGSYGASITNNSVSSYIDYLGNLSFAAGITGLTTTPTATFKYSVVKDTVTLFIATLNGTSNTTDCTLTNFPSVLRPKANNQTVIVPIQNNGVYSFGTMQISTAGVVTLSTSPLGGTAGSFTAANAKGILTCTVTYKLN